MRLGILGVVSLALAVAACTIGADPPVVEVAGADGAVDATTLDIGTAGSIDPVD